MILRPLLGYVRDLLSVTLQEGDIAVDATVGKGHDTLFLAERVGESGRVYGFDIQEQALAYAQARLKEAGSDGRVELLLESHARMLDVVPVEMHGRVKAVTFNFGYLPGGDRSVVTTSSSSVPALRAALDLLAPGGIVTAAVYSGHEEGKAETEAILD
ncbi:MAG: class I SAM-dependent methyltransferase, partial [Tumebacillaceae bacterium]